MKRVAFALFFLLIGIALGAKAIESKARVTEERLEGWVRGWKNETEACRAQLETLEPRSPAYFIQNLPEAEEFTL